jgi:hypothetical protein
MIILQGDGVSIVAPADVAARLLKSQALKLRVVADTYDEIAAANNERSLISRGICQASTAKTLHDCAVQRKQSFLSEIQGFLLGEGPSGDPSIGKSRA